MNTPAPDAPALVLSGPLLFSIVRQVGVHKVHHPTVVILSLDIGLFALPFGVGPGAACAVSRINPDKDTRATMGCMAALVVGLAIVAAVPWISTGFQG